jgi:hypothetical protein
MQVTGETLNGIADDTNILTSITMTGVGLVTSQLFNAKKITTDMALAGAGGGSFIFAEISAMGEFKGLEKDLKIEIINKSASPKESGAQAESLKGLKKSYVETNEILKKKKTFELVATTAFTAAAAAAYIMWEADLVSGKTCATALFQARVSCYAATNPPPSIAGLDFPLFKARFRLAKIQAYDEVPMPSDQGFSLFEKRITTFDTELLQLYMTLSSTRWVIPPPSTPLLIPTCATVAIPAIHVGCDSFTNLKIANAGVGGNSMTVNTWTNLPLMKKYSQKSLQSSAPQTPGSFSNVDKILNFVFPRAEALGMGDMLGITGATAGLLFSVIAPELASYVDTYLGSAKNRSYAWAGLAILTGLASVATQNEIDKVEENIKKIDSILKASGVVQNEKHNFFENILNVFISKVIAETSKILPQASAKKSNFQGRMPCLAGKGDANCPSLIEKFASSGGLNNFPPSIQNTFGKIVHITDDMNGSNSVSSSTLVKANEIISQRGAIQDLVKQAKYKLDSHYAQANLERHNFDEDGKLFINNLNNITRIILKEKGMSPRTFLASYGGTTLPKTDANTNPTKYAATKVDAVGTTTLMNNSDSAGQKLEIANAAVSPITHDKSYKMSEISGTKEDSIFSIISNRYFKSAYPKLLDQ